MKPKLWLSILCFLVGIAFGFAIAAARRPARVAAAHVASESKPAVSLTPRPTQVEPPSPRIAGDPKLEKPVYRDRVAALLDLNSLLRAKILVPLTNGEEVNEDFVKVFGLTAAEVTQLKMAFAEAKKRIAELEASHASIVPEGENAFTISILPFPKEGGQVYDSLQQSIHDVLGDERFAAYRTFSPDMDSSMFGMFGLSDTTIAIRPVKQGEKPTSTGSSSFDPGGPMKMRLDTNPIFFPTQYPAIYQKMVASGLWKTSSP